MPAAAAGQLPLPPLQTYIALSFLFLAWSVLQAREGLVLLETIQHEAGQNHPSPTPLPDGVSGSEKMESEALNRDASYEEILLHGGILKDSSGGEQEQPMSRLDGDSVEGERNEVPDPGRDVIQEIAEAQEAGEAGAPPPPPDHEAAILQNLSLDFGIDPDDSDTVKIMKLMLQDSLSVVVVINMSLCCLILLGKAIQHIVFGELRVIERQHLRDKLWNFSFYKLIVVFGVLNVQTLEDLILWVSWFAVLAFLHGFAQLSKERFEYLSFSPTTPNKTHGLVIGLLLLILGVTGLLMACSFYLCYQFDWNFLFFMLAECFLVAVRAIYVLARYAIHLYDLHHEGVWENRGTLIYHTELVLELITLSLDFVHHLHMLLWVNVFLSMASLLICMQLRHLYYEIQRRVQRHRNYRRVLVNMEARFPRATEEELVANNDDCAICWEEMRGARKLPCNHFFHDSCLRSWLEHETSCPTCRQSLNIQTTPSRPSPQRMPNRPLGPGANPAMMGGAEARPNPPVNLRNHFFHFDGSRIFSWLPSFSVEVTHAHMMGNQTAHTSQLDNMARQVAQMFPNVPYNSILADLRITRSIELTVDNILDGRVATIGLGNDAGGAANPGGTQGDTFPPFQPTQNPTQDDEGGMLYRQTRQPGEREVGEGSGVAMTDGMDGSEDNAANWSRPNIGLSSSDGETGTEQASDQPRPDGAGTSSGFPSYSSRFSKSSSERESMLKQRKEKMLQLARRKFQEREQREMAESQQQLLPPSASTSSSSSSASASTSMPAASHLLTSLPAQDPTPSEVEPTISSHAPLAYGAAAGQTEEQRQRLRAATLEAALRRLQQQQAPL
ncbi:E3 ubiquitin-protein ligase AMFR-like [Diadema antillarum]|uniref:E3 ubiquitin-protein ligase AMFR-like n=1 Tax=Diadema antillarum TaxID=105358 RepID=UPI003A83B5E8